MKTELNIKVQLHPEFKNDGLKESHYQYTTSIECPECKSLMRIGLYDTYYLEELGGSGFDGMKILCMKLRKKMV